MFIGLVMAIEHMFMGDESMLSSRESGIPIRLIPATITGPGTSLDVKEVIGIRLPCLYISRSGRTAEGVSKTSTAWTNTKQLSIMSRRIMWCSDT